MSRKYPDFYDGLIATEERLRAWHDARAERIRKERQATYDETKANILREQDQQDRARASVRSGGSVVDVLFPKEREDELTKELKLKAHRARAEAAAEKQAAQLVELILKELQAKGLVR